MVLVQLEVNIQKNANRSIVSMDQLSPCTKLKSKWIKNLHIKPDTLKLTEKKLGKNLEHMGTGDKFLNGPPIAYALRSRIDKWDLIKLLSFYKAKDTIKRTDRRPTNWEKIFTNPTSDRGLISFYHWHLACVYKIVHFIQIFQFC